VVPHPSTRHAHGCLASEIGRDPAFPTRYDRTESFTRALNPDPSHIYIDNIHTKDIIKMDMREATTTPMITWEFGSEASIPKNIKAKYTRSNLGKCVLVGYWCAKEEKGKSTSCDSVYITEGGAESHFFGHTDPTTKA
jgi:hypothetical protein